MDRQVVRFPSLTRTHNLQRAATRMLSTFMIKWVRRHRCWELIQPWHQPWLLKSMTIPKMRRMLVRMPTSNSLRWFTHQGRQR